MTYLLDGSHDFTDNLYMDISEKASGIEYQITILYIMCPSSNYDEEVIFKFWYQIHIIYSSYNRSFIQSH